MRHSASMSKTQSHCSDIEVINMISGPFHYPTTDHSLLLNEPIIQSTIIKHLCANVFWKSFSKFYPESQFEQTSRFGDRHSVGCRARVRTLALQCGQFCTLQFPVSANNKHNWNVNIVIVYESFVSDCMESCLFVHFIDVSPKIHQVICIITRER